MSADAETEAGSQHEHRTEALDMLATIELKFALLRKRIYIKKMEALTWEEALVENGTCHLSLRLRVLISSLYLSRNTLGIVAFALRAVQEAR